MTDLERANKYWDDKETLVWNIARKNNLDAALECAIETERFNFEQFLFDLFDYGEHKPTENEIANALLEVTTI